MKSRHELKLAIGERRLPAEVRDFRRRAGRLAVERDDDWAIVSTQRPVGVRHLLQLAEGRTNIVELGTANGWTAAVLALADRECVVTTFDTIEYPNRQAYWSLLDGQTRARIHFYLQDGAQGASLVSGVDFLFLDSSHECEPTINEFNAWRPSLAPGAIVVFDDFGHPEYPGVADAVRRLELQGDVGAGHFIWTAPAIA